jgi:hypothetical protein
VSCRRVRSIERRRARLGRAESARLVRISRVEHEASRILLRQVALQSGARVLAAEPDGVGFRARTPVCSLGALRRFARNFGGIVPISGLEMKGLGECSLCYITKAAMAGGPRKLLR